MQSIFCEVCVFLSGQLKASQSNWQFFLGEKTKQDDIKASFSYEESRRLSNTHFFFNKGYSSASIILNSYLQVGLHWAAYFDKLFF